VGTSEETMGSKTLEINDKGKGHSWGGQILKISIYGEKQRRPTKGSCEAARKRVLLFGKKKMASTSSTRLKRIKNRQKKNIIGDPGRGERDE